MRYNPLVRDGVFTVSTEAVPTATPPGPLLTDRAAEQRAADRELFARLKADEFRESPHLTMLRDRLWRYGWNVLRAWMKDGSIIARCRERHVRFPAPYTEVEEIMRRADVREDIAIDCLAKAIPFYLERCLPQWDPEGGRNLTSFFMHITLPFFRSAYRQWATGHRRRLREVLGESIAVYNADWDMWDLIPPPGPEERTVLRESLSIILAKASMEERAVCEAMLTSGGTQEEIAQTLGTTRKTVERRLSRVRGRARKLAAAGLIVVPSVSTAVTR
ncbi:RNA polymerase sigma factor [Streptomyces sp. NPDC086766]|uniref:RNA polymerase sigma factor n=1 Tax=Streptomyces sp. NPDC086766 TaxID=3365754 RepID=UPI00381153FB